MQQISGSLYALQFYPPMKQTAKILLKYCWNFNYQIWLMPLQLILFKIRQIIGTFYLKGTIFMWFSLSSASGHFLLKSSGSDYKCFASFWSIFFISIKTSFKFCNIYCIWSVANLNHYSKISIAYNFIYINRFQDSIILSYKKFFFFLSFAN